MLTSNVRIGISFVLLAGVLVTAESMRLLLRVHKRMPIARTMAISLLFAIMGAGEIVFASSLTTEPLWYYAANTGGILLVLAGAAYATAMRRSLVFPN